MVYLFLIYSLAVPPTVGHFCSELDPDFDGFRYEEQIPHCKRNVSTERKVDICLRDGVEDRTEYTVDHIIPLSLGGSNADENLWCQHHSDAVTHIEYQAYLQLKDGELTQQEAVNKVLTAKFEKDE